MRFVLTVLLVCIGALAIISPAYAQKAGGRLETIAAVVNEDIITTTDLKNRAELIILSSGQRPSQKLIHQASPQVLEALISESVQLQEARRQGVTISPQEIDAGIDRIAQNNNIPPAKFREILKAQGINMASMERQIKAQLGWGRVIQQVLRPRVIVSTSEIEAERSKIKESAGKPEILAAEIFLPVSKASDDAKMRQTAQRLIADMRGGQRFSDIARAHSASSTAAQGGMIGWVRQGQLEPALDKALFATQVGEISAAVKGEDGYYIFFARERRGGTGKISSPDDAVLTLRELVLDTTDMRAPDARAEAERIQKSLTGCVDITKKGASDKRLKLVERKTAISDLSASEKARLSPYDIGRAAPPEVSGTRAVISMVCARTEPSGDVLSDEAVERAIGLRRLDLLQKRYLRDLIAESFIERRL